MNPDVAQLKEFATEWGGHDPEFEANTAIGGAAANATALLAKQVLEADRLIKSIPRKSRREARNEILQATVSGYQLVRFLVRIGDPRLSGYEAPSASQPNMSRIMSKAGAYTDKEMAQVLLCPPVMTHAVDHGHIADQSGALWEAFGGNAKNLRTFGYMTGMRIGLAEQIEFGPFPMFEEETAE